MALVRPTFFNLYRGGDAPAQLRFAGIPNTVTIMLLLQKNRHWLKPEIPDPIMGNFSLIVFLNVRRQLTQPR